MLFRFDIGKSRAGGLGLRRILIYYMPFWDAALSERDRIEYRPTPRTLVHLLGTSALAACLLGALTWSAGLPWSSNSRVNVGTQPEADALTIGPELAQSVEELKRSLPPEQIAELERQELERQREVEAELRRTRYWSAVFAALGRALHWAAFAALATVAAWPLVSFPLQKVVIQRTPDAGLVIRKRGLWPSTRAWPAGTFGQMIYAAEEETSRHRYRRVTIGWLWMVKLQVAPQVAVEQGPSLVDDPEVIFYLDRQKAPPTDISRPPRSVKLFIEHLQRLTGIDAVGSTELESEVRGRFTRRRRFVTRTSSDPVVTDQTYRSLAEVPEHLRDDVDRLLKEAAEDGSAEHTALRVTIRDSDGNERTYTSLEEMPPEVREEYERTIAGSRRRRTEKDQP